MTDWVDATETMEQVRPGEFSWFLTWTEDGVDRRAPVRPMNESDRRCDAAHSNGARCGLASDHRGAHIALSDLQIAMGMILAP